MGAGASLDAAQVPASTRFFCHNCSYAFEVLENTRRADLCCVRCQSTFLEEFVSNSGDWITDLLPRRPNHGRGFSQGLNEEQSRRLLNASLMLRMLEVQLQEELAQLQLAYAAAQSEATVKPKGLSDTMKAKLRRPCASVDMICSQPSCPVCSDDFVVEVEALQMPCSHIFHEVCVLPWLESKKTCPICRYELNDAISTIEELERFTDAELIDKIESLSTQPSTATTDLGIAEPKTRRQLAEHLHNLLVEMDEVKKKERGEEIAASERADLVPRRERMMIFEPEYDHFHRHESTAAGITTDDGEHERNAAWRSLMSGDYNYSSTRRPLSFMSQPSATYNSSSVRNSSGDGHHSVGDSPLRGFYEFVRGSGDAEGFHGAAGSSSLNAGSGTSHLIYDSSLMGDEAILLEQLQRDLAANPHYQRDAGGGARIVIRAVDADDQSDSDDGRDSDDEDMD